MKAEGECVGKGKEDGDWGLVAKDVQAGKGRIKIEEGKELRGSKGSKAR